MKMLQIAYHLDRILPIGDKEAKQAVDRAIERIQNEINLKELWANCLKEIYNLHKKIKQLKDTIHQRGIQIADQKYRLNKLQAKHHKIINLLINSHFNTTDTEKINKIRGIIKTT